MSFNPDQILMAFADRVTGYVLETLGKKNVLSIFVAGSVARGEVAAIERSGFTEIYSDLDLYVVVTDAVGLEDARRRIRGFAMDLPRESKDWKIFPAPDVGVYSRAVLDAQQARPGTVEVSCAHRVLFGGADIPRGTDRFIAEAIKPEEGLYLLENRLAEIAETGTGSKQDDDPGYRRYVHYTLLKSCQDLLIAALIGLGRYKGSRADRMAVIDTAEFQKDARGLLSGKAIEAIRSSNESLLNLRSAVELGTHELAVKRSAVELILLDGWKRIGGRIFDEGGRPGWAEVISHRCLMGRWRANARELFVLGKRMFVPRARLVLRLGRLARLSPVEVLRLSGMVDLLLRHGANGDIEIGADDRDDLARGYVTVLDELTRGFGIHNGTVFARGRVLLRKTT